MSVANAQSLNYHAGFTFGYGAAQLQLLTFAVHRRSHPLVPCPNLPDSSCASSAPSAAIFARGMPKNASDAHGSWIPISRPWPFRAKTLAQRLSSSSTAPPRPRKSLLPAAESSPHRQARQLFPARTPWIQRRSFRCLSLRAKFSPSPRAPIAPKARINSATSAHFRVHRVEGD